MALANTKKNDSKTDLMGKNNGQAGEDASGPGSAEWLAERPGIQNAIEKGHAPLVDLPEGHGIGVLLGNDVDAAPKAEDIEQNPELAALAEKMSTIDADGDHLFDAMVVGLYNILNEQLNGALDPNATAQFDPATFDPANIKSVVLHKSDGTDLDLAWSGAKELPYLILFADDNAYADMADVNANNDDTAGADRIVVTLVGGEKGVFELIDPTFLGL